MPTLSCLTWLSQKKAHSRNKSSIAARSGAPASSETSTHADSRCEYTMQRATRNGRRMTRHLQHETCNVQHAMCNMRCATCNAQHAMCNMQHAMCNMRCATCDVQHSMSNMQCATCNVQHATCSVQHAMCNTQMHAACDGGALGWKPRDRKFAISALKQQCSSNVSGGTGGHLHRRAQPPRYPRHTPRAKQAARSCTARPIPAQMWASPGADVGQQPLGIVSRACGSTTHSGAELPTATPYDRRTLPVGSACRARALRRAAPTTSQHTT